MDKKEPFGSLEGYAASASEAFRTISPSIWVTRVHASPRRAFAFDVKASPPLRSGRLP